MRNFPKLLLKILYSCSRKQYGKANQVGFEDMLTTLQTKKYIVTFNH